MVVSKERRVKTGLKSFHWMAGGIYVARKVDAIKRDSIYIALVRFSQGPIRSSIFLTLSDNSYAVNGFCR